MQRWGYNEYGQLGTCFSCEGLQEARLVNKFVSSLGAPLENVQISPIASGDYRTTAISRTGDGVTSSDTSLILQDDLAKLCRDGQLNSVLSAVSIMDARGLCVPTHILSCVLQLCMDKADRRAARKLHHLLTRLGYDGDCHLASQLVHVHLLCGSLPEALQAFDKLPTTDAFLWSAVILAHAKLGSNWET
ncbi:hypothetical protein L7F22_063430 [Adiantum nelumboides]|nr:hypothetical protein [Adiantum nelumboides]